jgi:rhodanese-related sulfurtransferase
LLGGQVVGGAGVDKRIDVLATAIRFGGTVDALAGLDLAYAPQFGSAKDPVHIAAFVAGNQREGLVQQIPPGGTPKGKLIDVRPEAAYAAGALPEAINIPLPRVRESLSQLDKNEPVTVHCLVGQTSYNAARILMQSGFKDVWNLAGGYTMNKSAPSS